MTEVTDRDRQSVRLALKYWRQALDCTDMEERLTVAAVAQKYALRVYETSEAPSAAAIGALRAPPAAPKGSRRQGAERVGGTPRGRVVGV